MASGYDISASAASGLSSGDSFYNMSGINFRGSSASGGDVKASGGEVVSSASRQQMGGNQAVPDSNAALAYQPGGPDVKAGFNWLPVILSAAGVLVSIVAIIILKKR